MHFSTNLGAEKMAKKETEKKQKNESTAEKVGSFILKNRIIFLTVIVVVVLCVVGFSVYLKAAESKTAKVLEEIEKIEFNLTKGTAGLEEKDLQSYYSKALDGLSKYTDKGGIAGARADLLSAEILFRTAKFSDAKEMYVNAAKKVKGTYLEPICYFNAAVAYEELNDADNAIDCYKKAVESKDFGDPTHALFSIARILQSKSDYIGAKEYYEKTIEKGENDAFASAAKTCIIQMQIDGKVE